MHICHLFTRPTSNVHSHTADVIVPVQMSGHASLSRLLLVLLVLAHPGVLIYSAGGASILTGVTQEAANIQSWLVDLRRKFHQVPELMYEEVETGKLIRETLDDLGISYR